MSIEVVDEDVMDPAQRSVILESILSSLLVRHLAEGDLLELDLNEVTEHVDVVVEFWNDGKVGVVWESVEE